jgi:hypothetical protein
VLALIRSRNPERQAKALVLGADEVLDTTGSVQKIAAAVERLIGAWCAPLGALVRTSNLLLALIHPTS